MSCLAKGEQNLGLTKVRPDLFLMLINPNALNGTVRPEVSLNVYAADV